MTGVVVAGMHRSGTSLMTRLLMAGGWRAGENLLSSPTERYEEDASFVELHRAWLDVCLPAGNGHRDWGVSDGGVIDLDAIPAEVRDAQRAAARSFVASRDATDARWVVKDPRASLFLPVWAEQDSLTFVIVYRNPWDVVDSAMRLGDDVFCRRPGHALSAWLNHNRRLVEFVAEHRDRCLVIASEATVTDPRGVWDLVDRRIGLDGEVPTDLVDPARFVHRDDSTAIAGVYRDIHPEVCSILDELDRLADLARRPAPTNDLRALPGGTLLPGVGVQVIVPSHNDGDFLAEAIASVDECARYAVETRRLHGVELTVVDDGSTDPETLRIMEHLRAAGRQVITTTGQGVSAARNAGRATSRTAAVIPLDADNRLRTALIDAVPRVESGMIDVVHGPWRRFGMDDEIVNPIDMTFESLMVYNGIDGCALISRELLERLGGWDTELAFWEDWNLWLGAIRVGARVARMDTITFDYFVRPDSLSRMPLSDPEARMRVVRRITETHVAIFGDTVTRLIETIHSTDVARVDAERSLAELRAAHHELLEQYRALTGGAS